MSNFNNNKDNFNDDEEHVTKGAGLSSSDKNFNDDSIKGANLSSHAKKNFNAEEDDNVEGATLSGSKHNKASKNFNEEENFNA